MVWTLANLFWLFSVGLVVLFSPPSGQSVVSVGVEFCWNFPPFLSSQIRVTSSIHRDELIQTHRFSTYHGAMKYTWLNMTYLEKIWRLVYSHSQQTFMDLPQKQRPQKPASARPRTRRNDPSSLRARKGQKSPDLRVVGLVGKVKVPPTDGLELHGSFHFVFFELQIQGFGRFHEGPWIRKGFHVLFMVIVLTWHKMDSIVSGFKVKNKVRITAYYSNLFSVKVRWHNMQIPRLTWLVLSVHTHFI